MSIISHGFTRGKTEVLILIEVDQAYMFKTMQLSALDDHCWTSAVLGKVLKFVPRVEY